MKTIRLNKAVQKILVIKPSSLGDIVHSLPFLNALRENFPKSEIHWIVAKGLEGLLEGHPMIDRLWVINKDEWKKIRNVGGTISELGGLFRSLKKEKFDLTIDLQGLLRSGALTVASGAPVRIGFKEAREGSKFFYTHRVEGGKNIHAVDRYLKIAEFLGCDISNICFPMPLIFNPQNKAHGIMPQKEYAVLVPGARWPTKRWAAEKFGELASMLPIKSIVVGANSDIDISKKVVDNSAGKATSVAGRTSIAELISIMRNARFVVSNDSGPMHIAAALGIPVFAIFGPTNPLRTGPYGIGHIVISKGIKCSPCYKKNCKDVKCMELIDTKDVAEIIRSTFLRLD